MSVGRTYKSFIICLIVTKISTRKIAKNCFQKITRFLTNQGLKCEKGNVAKYSRSQNTELFTIQFPALFKALKLFYLVLEDTRYG